ncbi:MAG TPA: lipid-transfer protein [Acidimicrobiia bacterium]|nr:lipid-transfer protein [Acidimicrobiia bacterium]
MSDVARDVAVVATSQTSSYRRFDDSEPKLIMRCINDLLQQTGLDRSQLEFTIAGSCDYLSGMPFAFVMNIDGVGAWPPVYESHVEMDGAWALFEAWLRLQLGDVDIAVVIGSGKSSPGRPREVFALQTDPYLMAPLGMDPVSLAGIQARALIDAGKATERNFAEVVARSRRDARQNPHAQLAGDSTVDDLLAAPYFSAPLRMHDLPPISDGAAAVVIAAGDRARELTDRPAWIRGMDHRIESHHPGLRDLTRSVSTELAAERVALVDGPIDVAELMVNYSPEELILRDALGLSNGTAVNPSGGPLAGHPVMATGLIRVIEVADRVRSGSASRGVAHASSGPCLQQNLLCVLEGGG